MYLMLVFMSGYNQNGDSHNVNFGSLINKRGRASSIGRA